MAADVQRDYEINKKRSLRSIKLSVTHLTGFFQYHRAVDITAEKVREYTQRRQAEGAANASVNRELAALKRMFSLYFKAGRLTAKPYIPMLDENNARQGFLAHADFLTLQNKLPDYLKDPVAFLYRSGWRVSEMRAIEWRDVDKDGHTLRLRPEISKNKKARVLPLRGELLEILTRARENRRLDCTRIFHDKGEPIGDFRKAWHNACVVAGLGQFKKTDDGKKVYAGLLIHDLRRSAVRNLIKAGVPEKVAMELSGHKTRAVFDRYHIVDDDDLAEALDKAAAYLETVAKESKVVAAMADVQH
jgi:integrase